MAIDFWFSIETDASAEALRDAVLRHPHAAPDGDDGWVLPWYAGDVRVADDEDREMGRRWLGFEPTHILSFHFRKLDADQAESVLAELIGALLRVPHRRAALEQDDYLQLLERDGELLLDEPGELWTEARRAALPAPGRMTSLNGG